MHASRRWTLLAAAASVIGLAAFAPHHVPDRLPAQVRFANHLSGSGTWTVMANDVAMFTNIAPGTTTAYNAVTDSVSHLTLQKSGSDSVRARTNYRFYAGSHYTVTADYRNGGSIPVLSVERDRAPGDTMP